MVQMLQPQNHQTDSEFACQFLARMKVDDGWCWTILRSDEPHIFNRAVNNQNCYIWVFHIQHQQLLYSYYVTPWCAFTAQFILGLFFFETLIPQTLKT